MEGKSSPGSLSPSLPSPGCHSSLSSSLSAPKLMTTSLNSALKTKRSETKASSCKGTSSRRSEPRSVSQSRIPPALDDGRWPSVNSKASRRSAGPPSNTERRSVARHERQQTPQASSTTSTTCSSSAAAYATLPRKTRHVKVAVPDSGPRSLIGLPSPASREPSLNRAASLRRQRNAVHLPGSSSSGYRSDAEDVSGSSVRSKSLTRTLPTFPARRKRPSTCKDAAAQTVRADPKSPEEMEEQLLQLTAEQDRLSREVDVSIKSLLKEKETRMKLQEEVDAVNTRMLQMLGRDSTDGAVRDNVISEVESRLRATEEVAAKNHKELLKAQKAQRTLTEDFEKAKEAVSLSKQQYLDLQEESNELIDFLTAEKSTLAESLKEAEEKIVNLIAQIESKDKDIERQKDECRHLVKLSEQRRQEIAALQAKLQFSERLLVSQGGTTTAASVALDELCSRLESLLPASTKAAMEPQAADSSAPTAKAAASDEQRPLVGSESLQDLTQAIISCQSSLEARPEAGQDAMHSPTLTDQATELDKLVSKVILTFQSVIKQKELSEEEAERLRLKFDSEKKALMEANLQLEEKQHKMHQLEAAQRLLQQTSSDEISALKTLLSEKEAQLTLKTKEGSSAALLANWKVAAEELNRQYLAIDKALDVLHNEQEFVNQNPALAQLQADLEETNFRCVTLPALVPEELIMNGLNKQLEPAGKLSPPVRVVPGAVNGTIST
ncbi:Hypothetical predicted protein [Cloeon dipterum]|uniref:Uncharacterized protein n=1 Tax=Cloeon dipterum TaxID=197152 RepID=A0A8S1CFG0_9INSE|nr:Hypothetical predicted protein [Cloeon dipterum]